jgi:hypothetical protein
MSTTIELTALKIGIAVAVLLGACGATWFGADAYYSKALNNLEGQLKAASKAQQDELKTQSKQDTAVTNEVDNEAQQQIGSMAVEIADLSTRNADIRVQLSRSQADRAKVPGRVATGVPANCPAIADVQPERSTAPTGDRPIPETTRSDSSPTESAKLDASVLDDIITTGEDALKAELLFRQFERGVGQAKP